MACRKMLLGGLQGMSKSVSFTSTATLSSKPGGGNHSNCGCASYAQFDAEGRRDVWRELPPAADCSGSARMIDDPNSGWYWNGEMKETWDQYAPPLFVLE